MNYQDSLLNENLSIDIKPFKKISNEDKKGFNLVCCDNCEEEFNKKIINFFKNCPTCKEEGLLIY